MEIQVILSDTPEAEGQAPPYCCVVLWQMKWHLDAEPVHKVRVNFSPQCTEQGPEA